MVTTTAASGPGSKTITVVTDGLTPQQAADRKAIAEAWLDFWDVYSILENVPIDQREDLIATVAAGPVRAKLLASSLKLTGDGFGTYGSVKHRIYWGPPPADGTGYIGDCLDTSKFGSYNIETNKTVSYGLERDNSHGVFKLQPDKSWKLTELQFLADQPC